MTPRSARLLGLIGTLGLMLVIFILSSHALPPSPVNFVGLDKLVHATIYGLLAVLLLRSMESRDGAWSNRQLAAAIALASLYGVSDEVHQYFVPGRTSDVLDWCADTVGAFVAVAMTAFWTRRASVRRVTGAVRR